MDFVQQLRTQRGLSPIEDSLLRAVGVRGPQELWALLRAFPSLAGIGGFDANKLVAAGTPPAPAMSRFGGTVGAAAQAPVRFGYGAMYPAGAPAPIGVTIPMPVAQANVGAATAGLGLGVPNTQPIDNRMQNWPVRNQGQRGTCSAFAVTACRESLHVLAGGAGVTLSDQYLFWAAKNAGDPSPAADGTYLWCTTAGLSTHGVCDVASWPYNGTPTPNNVTQQTAQMPSQAAHQQAQLFRLAAGHPGGPAGPGAAAIVYDALLRHGQVAISLPVAEDPLAPGVDNWTTAVGMLYGVVLDPPPLVARATKGHAVCVTGFVPDANEATGGYFIVRNSWGAGWASSAPVAGRRSPEVGYGEVSATYVDRYLWEWCAL